MQSQSASLEYGSNGRDHAGIELGVRQGIDDAYHILRVHRCLVRTIRRHGIESIGHHDDAGHKWKLVAFHAVGISASIERFMMHLDAGNHLLEHLYWSQDGATFDGIGLHDLELFWS